MSASFFRPFFFRLYLSSNIKHCYHIYFYSRNRAPSVTSAEMKRQLMRTELEEASFNIRTTDHNNGGGHQSPSKHNPNLHSNFSRKKHSTNIIILAKYNNKYYNLSKVQQTNIIIKAKYNKQIL